MPAAQPEHIHKLFVEAFNAADVDAIAALYEPGAVLIVGGQRSEGEAAIRAVFSAFFADRPTMVLETSAVHVHGELALLHARWKLSGNGPNGPFSLEGISAEIARRQADGRWLCRLDNSSVS
jgi:uncharacterized protein (TIGR02246 family)